MRSRAVPGKPQAELIHADFRAASLRQNRVVPNAIAFPDTLTPAHNAKTASLLNGKARSVCRDRCGLHSPDAVLLRRLNKRFEQRTSDASPASRSRNVNTGFRHSGITNAPRYRTQHGPPQHNSRVVPGNQPRMRQPRRIPLFPRWCCCFETGDPAQKAILIDRPNGRPVFRRYRPNNDTPVPTPNYSPPGIAATK